MIDGNVHGLSGFHDLNLDDNGYYYYFMCFALSNTDEH